MTTSAHEPEQQRSAALSRYAVMDTLPEKAFDRITTLAARLFDAPIALISLIDSERQFFKACFGLNLRETPRSLSFCAHALHSPEVMVIPDATQDPRFCNNPLVTGSPHIRFYAGAPLIAPGGVALGTLCIIDDRPRPPLTQRECATLTDLAALVMDELELRLKTAEAGREGDARARVMRELKDAHLLSQLLLGIGGLTDLDLAPNELLLHAAELASANLDIDWGGLMTVEDGQTKIHTVWHSPFAEDLALDIAQRQVLPPGVAALVAQVGAETRAAPLFSNDVSVGPSAFQTSSRPRSTSDPAAAKIRAVMTTVLGRHGSSTSILIMLRLEQGQSWSARDRQLVEAVTRAVRQATEQTARRAALRESQAQLHLALDAAPLVLWTTDARGVVTLSEGRGLRAIGTTPGAVVGQRVEDVFVRAPDVIQNVRRALGGEAFASSVSIGTRIFDARYGPLRDTDGTLTGSLGVAYDVTDLMQVRQEAVRARQQAEALLELSHLLDAQEAVELVAQSALLAVSRALGSGGLVLWRREDGVFRALAWQGELPVSVRQQRDAGLPVDAFEGGVLEGESRFLDQACLPDSLKSSDIQGIALLPVALDVPERAMVLAAYQHAPHQPAEGPPFEWSSFERDVLTVAARTLAAGIERKRHLQALEAAASVDTLTGLGNRRALEADLEEALRRADRTGEQVGVLSIDLDGLKVLNDAKGHARGDALLQEFAKSLRLCFRQEDRIHRLGGDEYVVILPGVGGNEAQGMLDRVRAAVMMSRAAGFAGADASAGIASYPTDAADSLGLLHHSDRRMYADKTGKHPAAVTATLPPTSEE
ncbi:diguanylate cyclase domain-containing protein [Deinococcus aquatilis]|uniref:diguanylate cyclase domain-containing protein n=1 Tax=Deinococcus aquatilis TaxID=519440 RepID=UPI0003A3672A|nr:diguanylate cyclase [Deinococcus aquatilis]